MSGLSLWRVEHTGEWRRGRLRAVMTKRHRKRNQQAVTTALFIAARLSAAGKGPSHFMRADCAYISDHRLQDDLLAGLADPVFKIDRIVNFRHRSAGFHCPACLAATNFHQHRTIGQHRGGDARMQMEPDQCQLRNFPRRTGIFQNVGAAQVRPARVRQDPDKTMGGPMIESSVELMWSS